jgi:hypothetical protein
MQLLHRDVALLSRDLHRPGTADSARSAPRDAAAMSVPQTGPPLYNCFVGTSM